MKRFLFAMLLLGSCGDSDSYKNSETKPLMEAVYASGFVVSKDEYQVFAQAEGYVTEIVAPEGSLVKKGDVIFIIESQQQNARYRIAKEAYELAAKNNRSSSPVLSEAEAVVRSAVLKMKYDSVNLMRYGNLLRQNATTQAEYDRMKLSADNSRNDLQLQRSRLAKIRDQVSLDFRNAENQWKIASEESGRYALKSDVDGKVYKVLKEKGELARRNEAVALIGSKDAFYLQLSVDEMDVRKVQPGQITYVKIDAFPNQSFQAKVTEVHPLVDSRQQSLRVDADFTEPLLHGLSGLSVEANIVIRKKDTALVIPKIAVLDGDSVIVEGKSGKVKIKKGMETLDEVEVLEGLVAGDRVLTKF